MRLLLGFLVALVLVATVLPRAAGAVTVSIVPADTGLVVGQTATLRVVVDGVADLKGYQLIHAYEPTLLSVVNAQPGGVLTGSGRTCTWYYVPDLVAPADTLWLDAAMLDGATSGPGILETITVQAHATGTAHVSCASALLRDSANATIPADCLGAVIHITGPTAIRPASWGRLKSVYR